MSSAEQISSTVQTVLQEFMKSSERTAFWNEDLRVNVDPLEGIEGGFWGADWDVKVRVLYLFQLAMLMACVSWQISCVSFVGSLNCNYLIMW